MATRSNDEEALSLPATVACPRRDQHTPPVSVSLGLNLSLDDDLRPEHAWFLGRGLEAEAGLIQYMYQPWSRTTRATGTRVHITAVAHQAMPTTPNAASSLGLQCRVEELGLELRCGLGMWMVGGLSTHPTIGCRQQVIDDRCPAYTQRKHGLCNESWCVLLCIMSRVGGWCETS